MIRSAKELKRQEDLHRIFTKDLDEDELLLKDYSCTYHKDMVIRGRLYITPQRLCFRSSVLGWGNQLTIPLKSITSILKRRVVLLLPNALTICANGRKFVFSSFKNRNQAFNHLFKVWQNVLMDNALSPESLYKQLSLSTGSSMNSLMDTPHSNLAMNENGTDSTSLEGSLPSSPEQSIEAKGNISNEASDYFTEELATSTEDVSTILPPPVNYPSDDSTGSQTDTSIDSKSRISVFTKESVVESSVIRKRLATQAVPLVVKECITVHSEDDSSVDKFSMVAKSLYKHYTATNMVNVSMILMICLVVLTTILILCELSASDPKVDNMLSWLPFVKQYQTKHIPNSLHDVQLQLVRQLSTDLKILLLQYFNDSVDKLN